MNKFLNILPSIEYLIAISGLVIGFVMSIVLHNGEALSILHLKTAHASYTRCITDGAPPDNCVKTYLLPGLNRFKGPAKDDKP